MGERRSGAPPIYFCGIGPYRMLCIRKMPPARHHQDRAMRASAFFFGGLAAKMPEALAPVVASTGYLLVSWLFLYFLYKKRIFLKV